MKQIIISVFIVLLVSGMPEARAQSTKANNDPDADFKLAKEFFLKGEISLAYPLFKTLYYADARPQSGLPTNTQTEAKYYSIVCSLLLKDVSAVKDAKEFIEFQYNAPYIEMMCFQLAEYLYHEQAFDDAVKYYDKAGNANLTNTEISNMMFHKGYCLFNIRKMNEAKPLFNSIRQIPADPNYFNANYYYGFISFYEHNYADALSAFQVIDNHPLYKSTVPYYVADIYYLQGNAGMCIEYGEAALKNGDQYYENELKLLLGHAWFEKKNYKKALPYLEEYVTKAENISREDLYEISFCYYSENRWDKAIAGFKQLSGKNDSLAQNSMYLLGDAYLRTGNKAGARNAFLFCSLNSSIASQKEISLFNYAKLSADMGYQDAALTGFKNFIQQYPRSVYAAEAKELLVNVLANTNNYKDALALVQSIGTESEIVQKVYPQILYGRAVELINDQRPDEADKLINKIFTAPYNEQQIQPAYFWKGEIAYKTNTLNVAEYALQHYLQDPVTNGEVNAVNAHYTLGYTYLKAQQYEMALSNFQEVSETTSASATNVQQDAYLRSADCYFMQKQYPKAVQMYDAVINNRLPNADYAYYQKAIIAGAYGRLPEKIAFLQTFDQKYSSSSLSADANMEMSTAYMANENFQQAIAPLTAVVNNPNAASLKPKAYLNLGACYYNLNNNDKALENFRLLISGYPNATESDDATDYVRNIFVHAQQPGEYAKFMRDNGKNVSFSEEDSLTYTVAATALDEQSASAQTALEDYLTKFPEGKYNIDAHYSLAGIYNSKQDYTNALRQYEYVAGKAPNKFAEIATLEAARINYFQLKDYAKATSYFQQLKNIATSSGNKLESMRGLLRCQYKQGQWNDDAVANAKDLLQQSGIAADDKQIANMIIAKNAAQNGNVFEAEKAYKSVIALGNSEYSAEARYRLAENLFVNANYKEAETAAFDVIKKAGSYDYWITKSYILLGNIYYKEKDYFNAEATLRSVVRNAEDVSQKQEAQSILDRVSAEKKNEKLLEP
ncbi:MAG: tetratricopeptide repeat protein [Chitinophagaceae bacterium]|jgi:TolA-binding protein|nr:tetratricopeptide repeat protein [Chitinophagaceae bacterium]